MNRFSLNGLWHGSCFESNGRMCFDFSGTVPGCVHTDLMGKHIPEDIYYRDNADSCDWIEKCDWQYTRTFTLEEIPRRARLVFEGLDTYATILLNGTCVGMTDNMFISHSFEVAQLLRTGENTLEVDFRSPVREVEGLEKREGAFTTERMHTRRIQCTYGWDWVARFVSCGIWRDVYLDFTDGFGIKNVYVYTEQIYDGFAQIAVEAETENYADGGIVEMEITDPEGVCVYRHSRYCKEPYIKQYIDIPAAQLWYPVGYGGQPLYTLRIGDKQILFGIRTATVVELPDRKDSPYYQKCLEIKDSVSGKIYDHNDEFSGFQLLINGVAVMCKGANRVPSEPFVSAETDEKITQILTLAVEAGVNMLRVWGGGIFERQHFYNECDRLGILVTQDFLMACGHYPEEKAEFIAQLRRETEFAAYELRNHPSLVWWSGDNENAVWGCDTADNYHGRAAIYEGIMPVLNRLDPKRRFMLSSPCGGNTYASKTVGTTHNTQYLGDSIFPYILDTDMSDYKEFFATLLARFIAEEPTLGATALPSLRRFMTDDDIFNTDIMWKYHTKDNPCLPFTLFDLLQEFSRKVLGEFTDGYDRLFKLKYNQFEWIRVSMENIRRNRGFINGIVYWMWNDCWPAASGWSFVDYYCLPKASFYSFKRCAKKLIACVDKKQEYEIYLCNDALSPVNASVTLSLVSDKGVRSVLSADVSVPAAASLKALTLPLTQVGSGDLLICDVKADGVTDRAFYKTGSLPVEPSQAVHIVSRTEHSITVAADKYVHAVELDGEFVFDDNYFSLLPGEQRTVALRKSFTARSDEIKVSGYTVIFR